MYTHASPHADLLLLLLHFSSLLSLQDENIDASYSAAVTIGTPSQQFDLILDTGSSDLWVAGTECLVSSCDGITKYDPSSSSTFSK